MIGFNGGLIGKNNPTTALDSVPGMWTAREQEVAMRTTKWPGASDLYFSSVSLLLHGDGTNGSTVFTDNSPRVKTLVGFGNAQISTAQSQFGGASIAVDGTGDYVKCDANTDFDLGANDFTMELWCRLTSAANFGTLLSKGPLGSVTASIFSIEFNNTGTAPTFIISVSGGSVTRIISGTTNIRTSATWHHIAVCRSGNNTKLFVDGTQEGSTYTSSYTISAGDPLYIGTGFFSPSTDTVNGYIDDVRITKGIARYTANFTRPYAPFPNQ